MPTLRRHLFLAFLACALAVLPAEARKKKTRHAVQRQACATRCKNPPLFADDKAPSAADAEVLKLCPSGTTGKVDREAVRDFFRAHLDDPRLRDVLDQSAPWVKRPGERADWLAGLWTGPARKDAFTHVLCGDSWDSGEIGGLHLEARYRQLERAGKLCYQGPVSGGPKHDGEPCAAGQCLIRFKALKAQGCADKPTGGFSQGLDSIDLLALGARAYVACCMGSARNGGGPQPREGGRYQGPDGRVFQISCGSRNGRPGIATFFPASGSATCGP